MFGVDKRSAERDAVLQQRLARPQRERTDVMAVEVQQVEDEVGDGDRTATRHSRVVDAEALLQPVEVRCAVHERHHLAVDDDIV